MLLLKNPIVFEGETYDIALISLVSAPVIRGNDFTTAVNLQVIPARQTEDEIIQLPSHIITAVLTADARGGGVPEGLAQGYGIIESVIQGALKALNIIAE